ncbi:hypothetical protein [Agrobacterium tumefaciens]|uniref:hypothetical protein n=1 Tax=Agrobacterium tumefaciens TaxID=358 RepID=UPI00287E8136|nr:hypothetical protein [Agrobacterium tumefaciens]MDS7597212.1 hypothetical protein [Agrobacterium tumefaciens]
MNMQLTITTPINEISRTPFNPSRMVRPPCIAWRKNEKCRLWFLRAEEIFAVLMNGQRAGA